MTKVRSSMRWTMCALLMGSLSASGAVVFSDDFSGGSSQWSLSGDATVSGETLSVAMTSGEAGGWYSSATTVPSWSGAGVYTLTFDTNSNNFPSAVWGDFAHAGMSMPGGLELRYGYATNPGAVYYQGVALDTNVGLVDVSDWLAMRTTVMQIDTQTLEASVSVNGVTAWAGTLPVAPEFVTYGKIGMWSTFSTSFSTYDNVSLDYVAVPEPMTLALLAMGGVAGLRRRK